ncbi:MAG: TetR/AcrR family transcriptional regulator [Planctomycetota bacterium]|nr:TetR/AcrR family transcriptional regulator [Planctomycetales bacterium]REJ90662.1 MAG: TetR/AcrR family transcriptional regulator [Planctomycetota bacterium]REK18305.1 MAG: TetR/AcrR family transcriptional regulator [Planctomycetota bacterium]REK49175.1 MAG: TetR/AcrR family transcriptional regulator [Planctomycetota bacterium]
MPVATAVQDPEKRQAILKASIEVFAQQGFGGADVEVIADRAGVGKGTVYRYFGNKRDLFLATADAGMRMLEASILEAIDGVEDPVETIRRSGNAYGEFFRKHPRFVEILILERAEFRGSIPDTHLVYRAKNRGVLDEIIKQGIRDGVFRNLDVHEATNAFANLLFGTVVTGCIEGASGKLGQAIENAVDIYIHGILIRPKAEAT